MHFGTIEDGQPQDFDLRFAVVGINDSAWFDGEADPAAGSDQCPPSAAGRSNGYLPESSRT
jgi:hypothetical protein